MARRRNQPSTPNYSTQQFYTTPAPAPAPAPNYSTQQFSAPAPAPVPNYSTTYFYPGYPNYPGPAEVQAPKGPEGPVVTPTATPTAEDELDMTSAETSLDF